ncbi:queuosine biosynthesis protein QueD [Photobacterium aquae]|uniref:Queuosine biosynthesis protein QueD n=1 Tax=Photobacterium aquae TaxID=1195763 RepID=A0A0J1HBS9_9GAMM|nr:VC2046/SO_2500 family protein [Photobacterium aquae]KLV09124.1 queuosine biosynthesis protein QueD [Photobacterium aquae]
MQIHTIDKAQLIHEGQLGNQLNHAVEHGRRADFALMLAMLSPDRLETTPIDIHQDPVHTDETMRAYFELQPPKPLTTSENCYNHSARQAKAFHESGLADVRLLDGLKPIALTFPPQGTKGMPEELYHNLSGHERRLLPPTETTPLKVSPQSLYRSLIEAKRFDEMYGSQRLSVAA